MDDKHKLTLSRKLDHIRITLERNVESKESTLLEYVRFVHEPLPEYDLEDVSLETSFCGKKLGAPLMITGMTGGHPETKKINESLARIAGKLGLAIGVGSQRPALKDPSLAETYRIMREVAPEAFIVANIGAPQLSLKEYGIEEAQKAVDMIDADALAIHLNVGQEVFQYEGDPYYRDVISRIVEISENLTVPVIVKETGAGLSYRTVRVLYRMGIKCFDTAGLGGTSWIKVEALRAPNTENYRSPGRLADYWGNPTAISIVETRTAAPTAWIIGSGGIRDGYDAAKAIALGADIAGLALPALRILLRGGEEALERYLLDVLYQIKSVILMTGGRRTSDLWRARLSIWGRLSDELKSLGIDPMKYLLFNRLRPLVER
ncbi:MAG: type 2 isopentenyl-diphosphate Delta-isomerase [Desulfurococcales archaeon]|nr:type 2 isopentenyl-diphosphate Delta-isomerase [Desulfurococcales archaeon]